MFSRFASIFLGILLFSAVPAAAGRIASVEMAAAGEAVEISIGGGQPRGQWFALDGPRRLVVDLKDTTVGAMSVAGSGPVLNIRTAQFAPDTARVVLDLAEPSRVTDFSFSRGRLRVSLEPVAANDFARLVGQGRKSVAYGTTVTAAPAPSKPEPKPAARPPKQEVAVATPPPAPQPRRRTPPPARQRSGLPVVVIDPGHGGRDPGSLGPNGEREKDAVLGIARAIKAELESTGRYRAILTRDDDRYIPHRERTAVARQYNAELFISIHADSFPQDRGVSGATIYTLSETASDKEAERLAHRENRSDVIAGIDLGREDDDVTSILIDLAQRETMNSSAEFAALLQREMVASGVPFKSHFHRFAGFLVLKAPDVPAVLLETGYISNPKDARYLFSSKGKQEIASGVAKAVEAHVLRRLARR